MEEENRERKHAVINRVERNVDRNQIKGLIDTQFTVHTSSGSNCDILSMLNI